jgi:hypothetical protein
MSLYQEENNGWVLKAPYTTNSHYIRYPKNFENVVQYIKNANRDLFETMPYVMLQPCMQNRKEYKVVLFNQEVQYLSYNPKKGSSISGGTKSFSKPPHEELFSFAAEVVQDLKKECPAFICDGLVRVDIFQNQLGNFVVNEFESLEANYHASTQKESLQHKLTERMTIYWLDKINYLVDVIENLI